MSRKSLDQTIEFLKAMDRTGSATDVRDFLLASLKAFGVEYFFAGTIPTPGATARQQQGHVLLSSYPLDWQRRYFSRGYLFKDGVVDAVTTGTDPVLWSDLYARCPDAGTRRVFDEAGDFGIAAGFTVPLLTLEGSTGGFSFAGERLDIGAGDRGMLTLIANYAFGQLLLLRDQPAAKRITLAPRERETLQWAAEGKSDWEIGELMGISEHGADRNLRAARRKLGTSSRTHAVAQALRLGLIS